MGYPLRWTPPDETGWCPVEVTLRTIGHRLLLRPSTKLTLRINGISPARSASPVSGCTYSTPSRLPPGGSPAVVGPTPSLRRPSLTSPDATSISRRAAGSQARATVKLVATRNREKSGFGRLPLFGAVDA